MKLTPADYVIHSFGGVRKTARALGKTNPAISKWRSPEARGGTGGRVPGPAQHLVLKLAKKHRLDITAHDLVHGREVPKKELRFVQP